jgi:5-methylcytosine-specific restriction endonuclease McrA
VAGNPRNGRPYRELCAWLRAQGLPCWICGHNIGYELDAKHPMSFTLDHEQPLSKGGALLDRENARPAHRSCNSSRGNRTEPKKQPVRSSRRW